MPTEKELIGLGLDVTRQAAEDSPAEELFFGRLKNLLQKLTTLCCILN